MKLKLINKTKWHDGDLRKFLLGALRAVGARPLKSTVWKVEVHVARSERTSGWAFLGSRWAPRRMRVRLPQPDKLRSSREDLAKAFAQLCHHEALHAVGVEHKDMTEEQLYCRQKTPWADELVLRTQDEVKPQAPAEELHRAAHDDKLSHARAMHKKACTRRKRAETLEKKWARRLKMLEKK